MSRSHCRTLTAASAAAAACHKSPVSLGCFPATPSAPTTFFEESMDQSAAAAQPAVDVSMDGGRQPHARPQRVCSGKASGVGKLRQRASGGRLLQDLVWSDTSLDIQAPIPGVLLCSVVAVTSRAAISLAVLSGLLGTLLGMLLMIQSLAW